MVRNMSRAASPSEWSLLDGEFFDIPPTMESRKGTLFIEARLKDGMLESGIMTSERCDSFAKALEAQLAKSGCTFDMLEDVLADKDDAICKLGAEYEKANNTLQSLKVVEHVGPTTLETCFKSSNVNLKVQIFQLYTDDSPGNKTKEDGDLGELITMPHARFEGVWDELVFAHDLKADLIWMMTNILRFSKSFAANKIRRKLNPLILLHGPPGTGKTSLCLGLAQKISIRLSGTYTSTKLVQIKTANLLSKYYSESAKHVDDIFNRISAMCEEDSTGFICVLIDEVESIACSREYSTKEGESHDSLRATNALLTGLDRTARHSNVVFLFTSNMCDALEPAFIDRCGLQEFVGPPNMEAQYEILRSSLEKLITCNVIESAVNIPTYDDATMQATAGAEKIDRPGPKLLEIIKLIHASTEGTELPISGRSLGQLPEKALMRYIRGEDCSLDAAFGFLQRCVFETLKVGNTDSSSTKAALRKTVRAEAKKWDWGDEIEVPHETESEPSDEVTQLWDLQNQSASTAVIETKEKRRVTFAGVETLDETEADLVVEESHVVELDNLENQLDDTPVIEAGEKKRVFAEFRDDSKESSTTSDKVYVEDSDHKPGKKTKI
ncbi:P-loop containing nucleoside triphosphate hydrolase protein [Rhexocercosporidium sp. MPI-PUGE-AT-0058]|nr:P-loop containing nucleoside triphosphate hydrolase protein [Rhexocercosporidium sp. MPI-PUGE-AT-0058]